MKMYQKGERGKKETRRGDRIGDMEDAFYDAFERERRR